MSRSFRNGRGNVHKIYLKQDIKLTPGEEESGYLFPYLHDEVMKRLCIKEVVDMYLIDDVFENIINKLSIHENAIASFNLKPWAMNFGLNLPDWENWILWDSDMGGGSVNDDIKGIDLDEKTHIICPYHGRDEYGEQLETLKYEFVMRREKEHSELVETVLQTFIKELTLTGNNIE